MLVDEEIADFLEHYGKQGMKWGQRKAFNKAAVSKLRNKGLTGRQAKATVRYQHRVDAQKMAATGRQGKVHVLRQLQNRAISNTMLSLGTVARHPLSTKKAANLQLQKNKEVQIKISKGQAKVRNWLFEASGVAVKNIDYNLTAKDKRKSKTYSKPGPIRKAVRTIPSP